MGQLSPDRTKLVVLAASDSRTDRLSIISETDSTDKLLALKAEFEAWFNRGRSFIQLVEAPMSRILLGTICGLVYGALSAASMIPLSFSLIRPRR